MLVIGGGGAGLCAGLSAAEAGATVLVVEAESILGGSTRVSSGIFTAGGTSVQAALGVQDSPELFYQHYMDLNQWQLQPGLIASFCREAREAFEWLLGLGVDVPSKFSRNVREGGLYSGGVSEIWRAHAPVGEGAALVEVLEDAVGRTDNIEVRLNTRVDGFIVEGGRVVGARCGGDQFRAGAVVLCSGGLAHDTSLLERYYPRALESANLFRSSAPGSRGDHIRLGEEVRARIAGAGKGLMLVTADFVRHHHWTAGFAPASRVYVDQTGNRFTSEDVSYSISTGVFDAVGGWGWAVFDEAGRASLAGTDFVDWTPENVAAEAAAGQTVTSAPTIEALAEGIGVPPAALSRTIDRWNSQLPRTGEDPDYLRHLALEAKGAATTLDPIGDGPFYAAKLRPSQLICTHAGLEVNARAQVLDHERDPVPGLYAAGEAGGGVLGECYVGGGNAVANAVTMGRVAGRQASTAATPS